MAKALVKIADRPGARPAAARASVNGRTLITRDSETKGTPIDACMRSTIKRRGSEMCRTWPRIEPSKFPGKDAGPAGRTIAGFDLASDVSEGSRSFQIRAPTRPIARFWQTAKHPIFSVPYRRELS